MNVVIYMTYLTADALHLHFERGLRRGAERYHMVGLEAYSVRHFCVVCDH